MALAFTGTTLAPKSGGGGGVGRVLNGVRASKLKKGQNQLIFGADVMKELGLADGDIPGNATVTVGTGKFEGKIAVKFGDGPFKTRWTTPKRKTSVHIMSSVLPLATAGLCQHKVFADDKTVVLVLPKPEADASVI